MPWMEELQTYPESNHWTPGYGHLGDGLWCYGAAYNQSGAVVDCLSLTFGETAESPQQNITLDGWPLPTLVERIWTPNLEPWRQDLAGSRHVRRKKPQNPVRAVDLVATLSRPHPSLIFWADKGIPAWARIGRSIGLAKILSWPQLPNKLPQKSLHL